MNTNIYHQSEEAISDLKSGRTPLGSIVEVQYPSGNGTSIRFHGWNFDKDVMIGCGMGWDNGATQWFDIRRFIIKNVEQPKEELCQPCNRRVHMWHKHAMWCRPDKPFPLVATKPTKENK